MTIKSLCLVRGDISEKAMAPHSSTLAWKIPATGEPGGLPSMGSHRVGHDLMRLSSSSRLVCVYRGKGQR